MKILTFFFLPKGVYPFILYHNRFFWVPLCYNVGVLRTLTVTVFAKLVKHLFESHSESLSSFGFVLVIFRFDKFIFQEQNRAVLGFDFWLRFRKFCSVESWQVSH